ncbi:MAG: hypothetical protein SOZ59_12760 [Candidatus Limivivens sp.]|nr:hypothetical protein [Candidatus Limivivens sp.]
MEKTEQAALAEAVLRELEKRLNKPCVLILGRLSMEEEKEITSLFRPALTEEEKERAAVIAASLSVEGMVQAALGCPGNREAAAILSALLEGRKVYILEKGLAYRKYRNTAYKPLYGLYQSYEKKLQTFGAELIGDLSEIREKEPKNPVLREGEWMDFTGIRVLKESDLCRIRGNGISGVEVGKKTIITPLAQDYLTNHGLEVRRQEGR